MIAIGLVLGAMSIGLAASNLGISTDTDALFADSLGWKQRKMAFDRDFPQFRDLIVAVIDAPIPEEADATAAALAAAMAADTANVRNVSRPDASPYFVQNGLLFLSTAELGPLLDRTIDAQPFLGQLVADPSARGPVRRIVADRHRRGARTGRDRPGSPARCARSTTRWPPPWPARRSRCRGRRCSRGPWPTRPGRTASC